MEKIILFRFHKNPVVCRNRLELLKKFNPKMPIYGLYGGSEKNFEEFKNSLNPYLKGVYYIRRKTEFWKWKNGDLSVREWYKDVGRFISFDVLYIIEWDLLILDRLEKVYPNISSNTLGLAGIVPVKDKTNWGWISKEPYKSEWYELKNFVKKKYNFCDDALSCAFPGACLSKDFLEQFVRMEVPELCNDEIRLPLFAQILGFKLLDINFFDPYNVDKEAKFFNCLRKEIDFDTILREIKKDKGRRVFHPFMGYFDPNLPYPPLRVF